MIYPWQQQQWQQLMHAKQAQCFPHALLLTGIKGVGKVDFTQHLLHAFLCQNASSAFLTATEKTVCDCHACHLIKAQTHPNILWIQPEKKGHAIKIDEIRLVTEFIQQTALKGEHRFVIIHPAQMMNQHAANALLKTLEEPTANALLILITEEFARLPATIRSRCQRVHFSPPPSDVALAWLQTQLPDSLNPSLLLNLSHGAPLAALRLAKDDVAPLRQTLFQALTNKIFNPLHVATQIAEIDLISFVDYLSSWFIDLLRLQWGRAQSALLNQDFVATFLALAPQTSMQSNTQLLNHLQQIRRTIVNGLNLNKQLVIETTLIKIYSEWNNTYVSR